MTGILLVIPDASDVAHNRYADDTIRQLQMVRQRGVFNNGWTCARRWRFAARKASWWITDLTAAHESANRDQSFASSDFDDSASGRVSGNPLWRLITFYATGGVVDQTNPPSTSEEDS